MNNILTGTWQTPRGAPVTMAYREGTSDWNTISSVMSPHDEYGLAPLSLSGLAIDIGSHIGSVAIALALDNPDLRVTAVEPVPPNVLLLSDNLTRNGLQGRVRIAPYAAAAPGVVSTAVWYGARGDESAEHHAWIGNSALVYESAGTLEHDESIVACVSLSWLGAQRASFLKLDCEGCEWGVLTDPTARSIPLIVGELHSVGGHVPREVEALLPGHVISYSFPQGVEPNPDAHVSCDFRAVLHA